MPANYKILDEKSIETPQIFDALHKFLSRRHGGTQGTPPPPEMEKCCIK